MKKSSKKESNLVGCLIMVGVAASLWAGITGLVYVLWSIFG